MLQIGGGLIAALVGLIATLVGLIATQLQRSGGRVPAVLSR
jgi:hypothetical protein